MTPWELSYEISDPTLKSDNMEMGYEISDPIPYSRMATWEMGYEISDPLF